MFSDEVMNIKFFSFFDSYYVKIFFLKSNITENIRGDIAGNKRRDSLALILIKNKENINLNLSESFLPCEFTYSIKTLG